MKHLGDITKISGYEAPTVDIITGGSPCQDLSVAGKRAGLAGERSGLFMEQIRIIKEMRDKCVRANEPVRPRYMVWENVPGAFSSNKGEDFRAVLEETARVADKAAVIPRPEGGQWTTSGCILADGWSIAWRVHDAQFWGVPQRRKRIALVADFDGQTAPEILFERESVCGDITESGKEGQGIAADAERSTNETISFLERAGCQRGVKEYLYSENERGRCQRSTINQCYNISGNDISGTLDASYYKGVGERLSTEREVVAQPILLESNQNQATIQINGISTSLPASAGMGGGYVPMVCYNGANVTSKANASNPQIGNPCHTLSADSRNYLVTDARGNGNGDISPTITGDHQNRITDYTAICYGIDRAAYNQGANAQYDFSVEEEKIATCVAKGPGAVCARDYKGTDVDKLVTGAVCARDYAIVRRLIPLECERLQGYPDNWTDIGDWIDSKGKLHKGEQNDSARYKALGNTIALPFWQWLADRICKLYDRQPTMASLFDGIGGFPLVFSRAGAKPVWCSEIEEFAIAVTKRRFQ